ncbi:MAG: hypothetical protein MJY48_05530 [Bacteroidales bacterium]|nr:hypothetical protein [Bacteroidales bacterium]
MVIKNRKASIALLLCVSLCLLPSFAQKTQRKKDEKDLVRLIKATSIEMKTVYGVPHRISINATFLHNGTYLKCDTADWDVDAKYIKAWGNVRVTQDKVVLSSDKMDYDVEISTAKFRSDVVQLKDDKNNILRTSTLDYCTKDSVAIFHDGGSMTMEDGQIIESEHGVYDTNRKLVTFASSVNMYVDTVYVKTEVLDYNTDEKVAYFNRDVDFFREGDMLSASTGWYNRETETFYFQKNVHCMSGRREAWCDSMYYFKLPNDIMMLGDAQIQDTLKHVTAVADYILYESEIKQLTMCDNAAVAMLTQQNGKEDTLYCGADTLIYNVVKFGDIDESEKANAELRKTELMTDAVSAYRERVNKEAKDAEEKKKQEQSAQMPSRAASMNQPASSPAPKAPTPKAAENTSSKAADSTAVQPADSTAVKTADSTAVKAADSTAVQPADSTSFNVADSTFTADSTLIPATVISPDSLRRARADSLAAAVRDSAKVDFVHATGNVRVFRSDMQMRCDSMEYNGLDSIARFFIEPVIWNEGNRQYTSDSIFVLVRSERVDRANLRSNAMIITQEDSVCFDQIKSTEVMAFFNDQSELSRFDALGTAKAVFYLEENGALATVNVVDSKILSGEFKEGAIDKIRYFDAPKNDAYPTVQLPEDLKRLKGFNWQPERRPASKKDITDLEVKPNEMEEYASHPKPSFYYTKKYFPGGIEKVAADLQEARRRKAEERRLRDSLAVADTMALTDSLAVTDTTSSSAVGIKAAKDSLKTETPVSSVSDSTSVAKKEEKKISAAELKRQAREAARKAKWEELDRKDAARAEAKRQKDLAKKRKKTLKALLRLHEQDVRDARKLQRYIQYYEKQKARRNKNGDPVK